MSEEKLRLDKYLWAIRLFKSRTLAAEACDAGKIKYAGSPCKSSRIVKIGDEYEIKTESRRIHIKVTGLLHKRVCYAEAVKYYLDITPEDVQQQYRFLAASFYTGKRLSKIGRPTKKDRRKLDDFMGY